MKANSPKSPRLYLNVPLSAEEVSLTDNQAHYLRRVLRLKVGHPVIIFNGKGDEYLAQIYKLSRNRTVLRLETKLQPLSESPLKIILIQSLIKNDAMDMIVQKATELGIYKIIPVISEFSIVKLSDDRIARRVAHWEKISASACEQSGRHQPLIIEKPRSLEPTLSRTPEAHLKLVLQPPSIEYLPEANLPTNPPTGITVLIGPEGGLSERDLYTAHRAQFTGVTLGPRVMRTETATLAACVLLQQQWGDLSY